MCGGQRRAARCGGSYGAGNHYTRQHGGQSLVLGLIEGIQQIRLASQQQRALAAMSAPVAPQTAGFEGQTQGVIYADEKRQMPQQEDVNYEVLPTYEEVADVEKTGVSDAEATAAQYNEASYVPTRIELPNNANRSLNPSGLNEFNTALAAYRESECGGYCRARRAAKNLVRELASQEVARLEATHGRLACGQRKQIRKDLKPVKNMLKAAVKEARRERAC